MRHRRKTVKLQRRSAHRKALLSNLTCSLIEHGRIRTTLAKAKALSPVADRMVTLGKQNSLPARRQAAAFLGQKTAVRKLFAQVATAASNRQGGYTRITRLGLRSSDAAPMAFIEWVDLTFSPATGEKDEPAEAKTPRKKATTAKKAAKKPATKGSRKTAKGKDEEEKADG